MKNNLFMNYDTVDKASHLREGHILNHKDFDINKIKLTKIWQNKFSVKKINETNYDVIWCSGKEAYDLMLKSESLIFLGVLKGFFYFSINYHHLKLLRGKHCCLFRFQFLRRSGMVEPLAMFL